MIYSDKLNTIIHLCYKNKELFQKYFTTNRTYDNLVIFYNVKAKEYIIQNLDHGGIVNSDKITTFLSALSILNPNGFETLLNNIEKYIKLNKII